MAFESKTQHVYKRKDDIMSKIVSENTVQLLKKQVLPKLKLSPPLSSDDIESIFEYLDSEEIALSNAKADGEIIDIAYFNVVCISADELAETDNYTINLEDLNRRLSE